MCVCAVATWRFNTGSHVKVQSEADVDRIVKQTQWATPIVVDELLHWSKYVSELAVSAVVRLRLTGGELALKYCYLSPLTPSKIARTRPVGQIFANGLATSFAVSINSCANGLMVRFFSVKIATGIGFAGNSIGNTFTDRRLALKY